MAGSTRIDELRQKFHENPRRYFAPLANEYRKAGDPEQAIAICRAHLAQQPGHMSGHVVYGQALYDARRTEEARGVFEKALALDPDNAIVLKQLGDIAREKGDDAEAKHWYSRAIEADPHDKEIAAYIAELTEPETETETVAEPVTQPETGLPVEAEVPAPITPEIAPQEIEMVAEVPPMVELEPEPSAAPQMEEVAPPAEDDVAWRTTPSHEESPFVTRTMAELYAKQGYREAALDVYRQLALHHPDDKEIFDRIKALEKDSAPETPTAAPEKTKLSELPFEPIISDLASEPEPETVRDFSEPAVYGADAEDELVPSTPKRDAPHFTETEIGGDTWDTDAWGAGFTSEDEVEVEFDSPDIPETETEPVAPHDTAPIEPQVAQLDPQPVEPEPIEVESSLPEPVEPEPPAPEPVTPEPVAPEPLAPEMEPEPFPLPEFALAEEEKSESTWEEEAQPEPAEKEPAFVAYSPQLPADDDLPHFAPKGPTVREFFATLGAFRPSARAGSSITAHAAVSPSAPAPDTDFPLATDAFSTLFGDAPVSEDDSRAAFALSGALGESTPTPVPTPAKAAPAVEAPAQAATTAQESEEDIRRFREWLDGLQES